MMTALEVTLTYSVFKVWGKYLIPSVPPRSDTITRSRTLPVEFSRDMTRLRSLWSDLRSRVISTLMKSPSSGVSMYRSPPSELRSASQSRSGPPTLPVHSPLAREWASS